MRLENKVAIVTGSARGLGKAIALRFAQEGARLTVCDILDCSPVAEEIRAAGGEVLALHTDITNEADTAAMARRTVERFGRIDVLINNAAALGGIEIPDFIKPPDQLTPSDWDRMLNVNIKGTFSSCRAVIPYMKEQRRGVIINLSSTTGFTGSPAFLHYSTSKGGIITMTKGLAATLGEYNINVNAVAPGPVMTESMRVLISEEAEKQLLEKQLIKKPIQPKDVAAAALFLASDEACMITGQTLAVNAGEYMH